MYEKGKVVIPMFDGYGDNYKVWKDRKRNAVFERIRPEFQCLKG